MYKIVPITALTVAESFISSDKIIEISKDGTKMNVGENDYEHKNKFYLSACIENADRSLNSYLSAYDNLSNTYITSSLNDVYISNGNLITQELVDTILSTDAFLTKDGCKSFEAECISYISELKNKAVSIIMAKLNESFIAQNSVDRPVYGQSTFGKPFNYVAKLPMSENYPDPSDLSATYNFDFKSGEFTLAKLLFGELTFTTYATTEAQNPETGETGTVIDTSVDPTTTSINRSDLFASNYNHILKSYFENESYDSADDIIEDIIDENQRLIFNATDQSTYDFKIEVPKASFDYKSNKSIPIAKLITFVLKNQIYRVITNICNNYAALMISVPQYPKGN